MKLMPLIISSIIKGLQPHDESSKTSPWAPGWHSQSNGREKHKPVEGREADDGELRQPWEKGDGAYEQNPRALIPALPLTYS